MFKMILQMTCLVLVLSGLAIGKRDYNFDKNDLYSSSQVRQINIEIPYGNMEIKKSSSDKIEVHFRHIVFANSQENADDINRELNYKIEQVGDRLVIGMDREHNNPSRKEFWKKLLDGDRKNSQILLKILLPDNKSAKINSASCEIKISDLHLDLEINSASSAIAMENTGGEISCELASGDVIIGGHDGNIEIETASSDLHLNDIKGNLKLSAASGNIEIDNVGGNIDAEASSGDIRAYTVSGSVDLSTISGSIFADDLSGSSRTKTVSGDITMKSLQAVDGRISASSVSGQIHLEINSKFAGEIDISSVSGRVSHSFEGDLRMESRNRISGNIGIGNGSLNISSTSGDIVIEKY